MTDRNFDPLESDLEITVTPHQDSGVSVSRQYNLP
jgi:hypothetical protein